MEGTRTPFNLHKKKIPPQWFLIAPIVIIVIVAAVFVALSYRNGGNGSVVMEFSKPDIALIGQPFTVALSISNPSDTALEGAKLSFSIPEGISFLGQPENQRVMEQEIGDIGPGNIRQPTFNLVALSGNQTLKRVTAKLSYKTAGFSAQFEKESSADIVLGQPAVNLSVGVPKEIVSGEAFEIVIQYQNTSSQDLKDLHLQIDYPQLFKFEKSSRDPDRGNNYWDIDALAKGESEDITIRGRIIGPERSFFGFNVTLTADLFGQTYAIGGQAANLTIASSPISLEIRINNSSDYIARLGDSLLYTLRYKNNSDITFENLTLKLKFLGDLFDLTTIGGKGFFSSIANTFTWNVASVPQLSILGPGQEGSVDVSVKLKDNFPVRRLGDKNYVLKVEGQIESPTVPTGTATEKTISISSLENKVAGKLLIDAAAYFRDPSSGFVNSGPYPPRVDQPTQYTIHWKITNYAVDVSNALVTAFLQSGSRWTGKVTSNIEVAPAYDPNSGRVTWQIPSLSANKGILGQAVEAVFQIETTPAINQVGKDIQLMGVTNIQGHDNFTNTPLSATDQPLTTLLPDDKTTGGNGLVQP